VDVIGLLGGEEREFAELVASGALDHLLDGGKIADEAEELEFVSLLASGALDDWLEGADV
jgi:hypothetical protein